MPHPRTVLLFAAALTASAAACHSAPMPPAASPPYAACAGYHVLAIKTDATVEASITKGEGKAAQTLVHLSYKRSGAESGFYELEKVEPAGTIVDDGPPAHVAAEGQKVCFEWSGDDSAQDACLAALVHERFCTDAAAK